METIANISKLMQLHQELAELKQAKLNLPRLSQDDIEDVNDNYQSHLELNYEIEGLIEEIRSIKRSGLGD
jgi:hypothetical protein